MKPGIRMASSILAVIGVFALLVAAGCGGGDKQETSEHQIKTKTSAQKLSEQAATSAGWADREIVAGVPGVPPELGGPGFAGEGWQTAVAKPSGNPKAVKGGKLRMAVAEFPATLRRVGKDENSQFNRGVSTVMYESLLNLDEETLDWVRSLATHWKISEDKMTLSYRINPEARWSDGAPVTSDDVIASWRLRVDEGIISPSTNITFGDYEEPIADSPYIVHVTLKKENWRYFIYFSGMSILPAHVIGGMTGAEYMEEFQFKPMPITGPYEIREENIIKDVSITLSRRDDYWAKDYPENVGMYNFDEIEWAIVLDERLHVEKFKKGELDVYVVSRASWWVNEFNFDEVERGIIQKRKIYNQDVNGHAGLAMNTRKPPFDDIRVRRAIAHLWDRDKLIEKLFYNEYLKLKSYHPGGIYENPNNEYTEFDPQKAVDLLAEAGWKDRNADGWLVNQNGDVFEIDLAFTQPSWERIHSVLQEDLAKVGIKLNLKQVTPATNFKNNTEYKFTLAYQGWGGLIWPNPNSSWLSKLRDQESTNNITGMANAQIDSLAALYDVEYDQQRRVELIREIDAILMEEAHYALGWYGPFTRMLYWNKFGYPDGLIGRLGDYLYVQSLWYIDEEKEAAMNAAIGDPNKSLPVGVIEDRTWASD